MRYILIAALLAGCSAGSPTINQRDALRTFVYEAARQSGAPATDSACMSAAVDKMGDADIAKAYTLISGTDAKIGSIPELVAAISPCAPKR